MNPSATLLLLLAIALHHRATNADSRAKRSILDMFRHAGVNHAGAAVSKPRPAPAARAVPSNGGNNGNNGNNGNGNMLRDLFSHSNRQDPASSGGNEGTMTANEPEPMAVQEDPYTASQRMDKCCQTTPKVGNSCRGKMCAYERFNKNALINAYLTKQCSPGEFDAVLACANRCMDHRACCQAKNLPPVCDFFCASRHMPPPGGDMMKFLPCADRLNDIVSCFTSFENANPVYPSQGLEPCS